MIIHTVAALAAAGKTYEAIIFAVTGVRAGERFIFCVPSTLLVDQIASDCRKAGCPIITAIHNDDGGEGSVVARLTKHFQTTDYGRGEIVVMTMAALERIRYLERRNQWHLIVDEVPTPVYHERFTLSENRHHLLRLVSERAWNASYAALSASEIDMGHVADVARNPFDDQITGQISELANKLLSDYWQCFALNDQLANFRNSQAIRNALDVFALLRPTIFDDFKSVTMMGACLEDSLTYRYWLSLGVEFRPHPKIKSRFTSYPNAALVTVQYVIDRSWSGKLRDTVHGGKRVIEMVAERCVIAMGGDPFVYLVNKNEADLALQGEPLPHVSHGLNCFETYHNAMLLSALNPPPAYFGFCNEMMGLDSDEVKTAIHRATMYQAAMRISIRNLKDTNRKRIQVVDKVTAIWLANLIGTDCIEKLPGDEIVPTDGRCVLKPKTNAEKIQAHRQARKAQLIAELDQVNGVKEKCYPYTIKDMVSPGHVGSIFDDKYSQYGLSTRGYSVTAFRNLLADAHRDVVAEKTDRSLICPAVFNPTLAETWRGKENIVSMSGIWLDNDGGDMEPADFARMLNVPLCIFNSFSSTVQAPRWRVWIPTSHLVTIAVHQELLAQIRKMLIRRGYYGKSYIAKHPDKTVKHHGFDEGKFTQAVLFYLPAQAGAGSEASFFHDHNWDAQPLNPYEWVERSIADSRPPTIAHAPQPTSEDPQTTDEAKVAAAEANWQSHGKEEGNSAFFRLACAYKRAGLCWNDAEPMLQQQAHYAHQGSKADRLADLKGYRRKIWRER